MCCVLEQVRCQYLVPVKKKKKKADFIVIEFAYQRVVKFPCNTFTKYTSSTYPSLAVQYIIFTMIQPKSSFSFFDSGTTLTLAVSL